MKKKILCVLLATFLLMTLLTVTALSANDDDVIRTTIKIGADGLPEDRTASGDWSYSESVRYGEDGELIIDQLQMELEYGEFYLTGETLGDSMAADASNFRLSIKINANFISGSTGCNIVNNGTISGGNHSGDVVNDGLISGGTFTDRNGVVNSGTITGGLFKYGISPNPGNAVSCKLEGVGGDYLWLRENTSSTEKVNSGKITLIPGVVYNIYCDKKPAGLYIVTADDSMPSAPYKIQTGITPVLGGFGGYSFVCPDKDFTVYAYFFDEPLSIDGGIGENTFVFYKGVPSSGYAFSVNPLPESITDFTWSAEGLPDGLKLTENTPDSSVKITGTPTTVSDVSDVIIKVSATDTAGKKYYGELTVKVAVEEPYVDVKTLVENAACIVPQETANTEAEVLDWLNETWLPGLLEGKRLSEGEIYTIRANTNIVSPFTAAVSGTSVNPDGTDGVLSFELGMALNNDEGMTFESLTSGTATIKASAYSHTHTLTHHPRVEPTHFTIGRIEHWVCNECKAWFSDENGTQEISPFSGYLAQIPHSLGFKLSNDENGHWRECSCGAKFDYAAHSYATDTWESDADGHWHECVCGAKSDYALHIVNKSIWSGDADGHWHPCDICAAKLSYEAHNFGTDWVSDANGHWHECKDCGAKADYTAHSPGTAWKSDMLGHWHECSCGAKTDYAAHTVVTVTDKEATETSTGAKHTECSVCKYVLSSTIIPVIDNTPDVTTTVDEKTGITIVITKYKNGSVNKTITDKNGNKTVVDYKVDNNKKSVTFTCRGEMIYSTDFEGSVGYSEDKMSITDLTGYSEGFVILVSAAKDGVVTVVSGGALNAINKTVVKYYLDGTVVTTKTNENKKTIFEETKKPDGTVTTKTFDESGNVTSSETKTADGFYLAEIYTVTDVDAANTAVVGADLMKNLAASTSPALNVQLPGASISFDAGAIDAMNQNNTGRDFRFSAERQWLPPTFDIDSSAKKLLDRYKNADLWEFRLNDGGADFGNGTATVEVEYTRQNPNATVAAYHFLPDGSVERVLGTAYKDGKFAIPMKGWSMYAIVEELEGEADTTDGNSDKDNLTWLWITVAAVAVAAAGVTGVILYGKHKKKA